MNIELVEGARVGRWTAVRLRAGGKRGKHSHWLCRCECGNERWVQTSNLLGETSLSCGCARQWASTGAVKRTHGLSRTREWSSWRHAKSRCYNLRDRMYPWYGARGVTMCDRWRSSFEVFLADMGKCPDGYSLDRIDPCGHYEPSNCRWADAATQGLNRRPREGRTTRVMVTQRDGTVTSCHLFAKANGVPDGALRKRLARSEDPYAAIDAIRKTREQRPGSFKKKHLIS